MNTHFARANHPTVRHAVHRAAAALGLAILFAPALASQTDAPPVSELLARANEALGWERVVLHPGVVRVQGAARLLGTDAAQTDVFDGRGRWVQTFEGPLSAAGGFDGETDWSVDWTGTPRVLELGDAINAQLTAAFLYGSWSAPTSTLVFTTAAAHDGQWVLEFTAEGGYPGGSVRLDMQSHLPLSASWTQSGQESNWTFGDYQDHDGFRFPDRLTIEQAGLVQSLATGELEFVAAVGDALFEPRLERPGDTHFDAEVAPRLEVKRAPTGHLLVRPTIDGKNLGWFIFDTGAGANCISTAVAEQLTEGPFGAIPAQGVGGTVMSNFWRAEELQLGPVTIEDPIFVGLDLAFLSAPFGVEVGGIIGYELLARSTVEFDQSAPHIALFDPNTYELSANGLWEDVLLLDRHPCVRASFEGREGVFKLDTGAAGDTVTMHAPAVRELALLEGRETTAGSAGGVGGRVAVRNGELASFDLGGHSFGAISASFAIEDKGAFSNPHVWGNMGGRLFEPFVLVFDYPHQRLGFVRK